MTEWTRTEASWSSQVPVDVAWSFVSRSFLLFMFPLVMLGNRTKTNGPLERENLPGLPRFLAMTQVQQTIVKNWDAELKNDKPSLFSAIWRSSRFLLLSGITCSALQGVLSAVGRPLVLRSLVNGLQSGMGTGEAVGLVFFFAIVSFLEGWIGVVGRQLLAEQFATQYSQSMNTLIAGKIGEIDVNAMQQAQIKATNGPAIILPGNNKVVEGSASLSKVEDAEAGNGNEGNEEDAVDSDEEPEMPLQNPVVEPQTPQEKRPKKKLRMKFWRSKKAVVPINTPTVAESALIGNDLVRTYENMRAASALPMATASVIGGVVMLLVTVGSSSLTGLAIMLIILFANVAISRISFFLEKKNLRMADERLQIVSSILESVRAVKLFGWESRFLSRVEGIRDKEVVGIAKYRMAHVTNIVMGRASPVLSSMVTLVVFSLTGSQLNMANAFVTVSVFQSLRLALIMIPLATQSLMAVSVSLGRMQRYLLSPVVKERQVLKPLEQTSEEKPSEPVLELKNLALSFDGKVPILTGLSCAVNRGEIVALCGQVGSGKTTFLRGALQLLRAHSGSSRICEHVGYVPQRALVIGGTIKDNVLLGRPWDETKFLDAITKSQLKRDIDSFPSKEMAEVGERGTTLSGGQMQRLSMARALYSRPTLLCLDDPFSAVDPKVCRAMFEGCILNEARGNSKVGILMVLNQLSYLPQCDRVLFLNDKRIHVAGPFTEIKNDPTFMTFVKTFAEEGDGGSHVDDVLPASDANVEEDAAAEGGHEMKGVPESILKIETRSTGAVSKDVYWSYLKAFGPFFALLSLLTVAGGYGVMTVNDFWLSRWSAAESDRKPDTKSSSWYAGIYAALSICFGVLILLGSFMISVGGVWASKKLHNEIIRRVLWAPMSWFESNPTGRVMSRFAGDVARVDLYLSLTIDNAFQLVVQLLATIIVVCVVVSLYLIPVAVVALILCGLLLIAIDRTLREIKRLANAAMSPVLSNVAETAVGLREVAKAFGKQEYNDMYSFFRFRHMISCDEYCRANFFAGSLINFSFLAAHVIAFFIAVVAATLMVSLRDTYDSSLLGLALTYSLVIPYLSSMSAQSLTTMNMSFTSLERLLEYKHLPQEAPHSLPDDPSDGQWPTRGEIEFKEVEARYRPGLPLCLKGCSFKVRGGESIGIVGRTGSGKSSLIAVLFRLIETCSGQVLIDGIDTKTIGLDALRSRITIIPQEPILMSGTVRYNLDPFNEFDDAILMESLERVGLGKIGLKDTIEAKGSNISAGERQLLCFARALVLKSHRIIVMDEPSSSLDMRTDETIVRLVQDELRLKRKCTILTVAHRVETIIQADRILVMRDGRVTEYDQPRKLLRKQGSEFSSLVSSLGTAASSRLLKLADNSVSALDPTEE